MVVAYLRQLLMKSIKLIAFLDTATDIQLILKIGTSELEVFFMNTKYYTYLSFLAGGFL